MTVHTARMRMIALAALILLAITSPTGRARGATKIELAREERAAVAARIDEVKALTATARRTLRERRRAIATVIGKGRHPGSGGRATWLLDDAVEAHRDARRRAHHLEAWAATKLVALKERWRELDWWLDTYGIFKVCPVPRFTQIDDDFGQMVRLKKVPVHRHQGSDISAPTGSPILAPFEGYASTSWSKLGGREVRVRGERGYVYNAHLLAVGKLGYVRTGDVVGYVGSTGDATGPHDHFEWHPWNGVARDPYPYLVAACVYVDA